MQKKKWNYFNLKIITFTHYNKVTKTIEPLLSKKEKLNNEIKHSDFFFLQHEGESAQIIQNIEWSKNSLGIPEKWPENLKNTLSTILATKFPMLLWWGDDLIQFYNDSYRPSLGNEGKHPQALGQKAVDCWQEIWYFIHPLIIKVLSTGESIWYDDLLLPIYRNGKFEDAYWTFSYSAVRDDERNIKGVLVICNETTDKVNYNLKLKQNKDELEFAINAAEFGTFDLNPKTNRFSANTRLKNWFGLKSDDEILLSNAVAAIAEFDRDRVNDAIIRALQYESGGKYDIEYTIIDPRTKYQRAVHALGKVWFDENNKAYRFNGTLQDITDQKKAAEELHKSRQLTDLTIKSMGLGLFNVDYSDNSIEYSSEFSTIICGNVKSNFKRNDFLKYVHPEDLHLRSNAIQNGIENDTFYYTPRVIWDDGTIHRIAVSASRILNVQGKAAMFSGTVADITEQENSRLALQRAESLLEKTKLEADRLFKNVTDSSPTGLWLSNKEGMLTYFNKTLIDFTGLEYDYLLAGNWTSVIDEEYFKPTKEAYLGAISTRGHFDMLFKAKKSGGDSVWYRAAGDPFYDTDGNYGGYAGFCMDIDEIITGRKAVTESQHKVTSMIEQSPVGISLFTGLEMKIEIANDIMIDYWGKDQSVINQPLAEAVPELSGQPFLEILQQVYRSGETYYGHAMPVELKLNGELSTYYFEFTYTAIRDLKGEIYGVMDIAIDITDQVMARKKLDETRLALTGAIELAELGTWNLKISDQTITCSDRFKEWLGLDSNIGQRDIFLERIVEPYRKKVADALEEISKVSEAHFYDYEFPIVNKITGQLRIVHANGQFIYSKEGLVESLSGTAQDVTKERQLQEELKFKVKERTAELHEANSELEINNRELSQFAYIASHDLQEPIRKISVFTDLLKNNLQKNPEKVDLYINKISSSAKRMENLIKNVLQFSKLADNSHKFETVKLNDIIADILNDFELTIEQKKASINIESLPVIEAIPLQMSQLFGNLISNALKYIKTDIDPKITIAYEVLPESFNKENNFNLGNTFIKITISDNGIGFSQQYAEQIFNIFQRLHGNDKFAGTGIGLAMCRKILQNHKGSINAESQEGVGTIFTLIIPQVQEISQQM